MTTPEERQSAIDSLSNQSLDAPEIGERLVREARKHRISDIHFDENKDDVRVRWRCDGLMENLTELPLEEGQTIARFFKVAAGLPPVTAEEPDEGFFEFVSSDKEKVRSSIRVSSILGSSGTKTSLRLLDSSASARNLSELGLDDDIQAWLLRWAEYGSGLTLVCGPTGSGKTTTLYALLEELQSHPLNIISIEDPVERNLEHVTQIDISLESHLTVGKAMRAILRHDPDIIFLGEIRDSKIAQVAVEAAFSGHVVLSTMHARDPAGAVTRLRGFGLPDHEIAAALSGVLAQRLARHSIDEDAPWITTDESEWLASRGIETLKDIKVESGRSHKYRDRSAVYEWWPLDENGYHSILDGDDELTLRKKLRKEGIQSLIENGLEKVRRGEITVEEIQRFE